MHFRYGEQKTKIVIQVESYTPTPDQSVQGSQLTLNRSEAIQHRPSLYRRLQSFSRVFTPAPTANIDVIDEESEPSDLDEVDGGSDGHNINPIEDMEEEDQGCVNRYLLEVCRKFEVEFGRVNAIKMMGFNCDEVSYKLPRTLVPLSKIFEVMERMKKQSRYHIVNYSISQSSLEQVSKYIRYNDSDPNTGPQ